MQYFKKYNYITPIRNVGFITSIETFGEYFKLYIDHNCLGLFNKLPDELMYVCMTGKHLYIETEFKFPFVVCYKYKICHEDIIEHNGEFEANNVYITFNEKI